VPVKATVWLILVGFAVAASDRLRDRSQRISRTGRRVDDASLPDFELEQAVSPKAAAP